MGVRVMELPVLLNNINVGKSPRKLLKIIAAGGRLVETVIQKATLADLHGFSVEKNPRNPAKVTVFGGTLDFGIYEGTARVTEILHSINVEKFPQTLLKVAAADGGNIWETAALVAEISLLLNSINVEKNLRVPATIPFLIKLGLLEFYKKGGIEIWRYE